MYIDGSHAAKDVIADAVLAWALLRPGGVLIFDGERWRPLLTPVFQELLSEKGVSPNVSEQTDYRYEHVVDLLPEEYPRSAIDAFVKLFAQVMPISCAGAACLTSGFGSRQASSSHLT